MGLFTHITRLTEAQQVDITEWYRSLDPRARDYVDKLRTESYDEGELAGEEMAGW